MADDWHGTPAGYQRHRKEGTETCQACRDAHAAYARRYRAGPKAGAASRRSNKARNRALTLLARMHPDDYQGLYAQELGRLHGMAP